MYDKNQVIHIVLFTIYIVIILFTLILYLICKLKYNNYNGSRDYLNILIMITVGVLINSSDLLIYGVLDYNLENNNFSLLKFNIVYVFDIFSIIIYIYRGIKCYLDHFINEKYNYILNKNGNKLVFLFSFVLLQYIIIINILYKDSYIDIMSWIYYPYYVFVFLFILMHPIVIYLLNNINNKIRNDFILSLIIIIANFTIFIISGYIYNETLNNFKKYWSLICSFLIYVSCILFPVLNMINNRLKIKNKNNIYSNNFTNIDTLINNNILNTINKYKEHNKNEIKDDFIYFYENYILFFKNNEKYIEIIKNIEYEIDNDKITKDIFKNFMKEITYDLYVQIYEEKGQ